ncbi:MAG TPA: energy transducer TonB, partial [Mucilaginibacter sp.]|nr:energy transducer TonB [Mucilaginibacter sp.]
PEFPGGIQALMSYLKDNNSLKGTDKNINGRVILSFVVEINGTLTDIKVARGISTECDAEALRMLKLSP